MIGPKLRGASAALGLGLVLANGATAHEDDPKILHLKAPVQGSGFSAATNAPAGGGTIASSLGFPASGLTLQAWLTTTDLGNGSENGNDCWGYTSPSGREYALMGTTGATVVVEVTNPSMPQVVARIAGPNSLWRDIKTYQDRAYAVSEGGNGIQVIDLSNVDSGVVTLENTITGQGTNNTHNVAIDEDSGFLYRCGGGSEGLRIYSLANPSSPQYVGSWSARYVHDAQIVTYTSGPYAGREIAYCCAGLNGGWQDPTLSVVDVTNKANPLVISQVSYPSRQYSHQGWLSPDRTRFYLGDELDEGNTVGVTTTRVFDVSDPGAATYLGAFDNGDAAIGHNMYSRDGLLFQANYTSGLRVFDIGSNINNPAEIAYFDTAPTNGAASFNGMWSVYPYFPSGTIVCSDIESGLFVLTLEGLDISVVGGVPNLLDPAGDSVTVDISELLPGTLDVNSVELVYDIGAGFTSVPMTQGAGNTFTGAFPAVPCGTNVAWYVTAGTTAGGSASLPSGAPGSTFSTPAAAGQITAVSNDMETGAGWTAGAPGDTATTGQWVRGNPIGTDAQPEDDHTAAGTQCWFTGQGTVGGAVGQADVDGGTTTLLTDSMDLTGLADPVLSYFRWYSNSTGSAPNADVFEVDISGDGGATWTSLEVVGPTGPETAGGWFEARFRVADYITPTSQVRVRFIASDLGSGSIVEAAVDDFQVTDLDCGPPGSSYCVGVPNSTGNVAEILSSGSAIIALNDLGLTAIHLPPNQFGLFVVSPDQTFVTNVGGGQGNLCVGPTLGRYNAQIGNSGLFGTLSLTVDNTAIVGPSSVVAAMPGDTFNFQCWYRDANPGATSNMTRGFSVTFQ